MKLRTIKESDEFGSYESNSMKESNMESVMINQPEIKQTAI